MSNTIPARGCTRDIARAVLQMAVDGSSTATNSAIAAAVPCSQRAVRYGLARLFDAGALRRFGVNDRVIVIDETHPLWAELGEVAR